MVISGHAGPFNGNLAARFEEYKQVIINRDGLLLGKVSPAKIR